MPSKKTDIIESLFFQRWNSATQTIARSRVTLTEIVNTIRDYNATNSDEPPLSDRNPANFFKDFIRKTRSANANFPKRVFEVGYTARQVTGDSYCFEFVRCQPGQTEPFPKRIPEPDETTPVHQIGTISIPAIAQRYGVEHETWLVQVIVELRLFETHFSLFSERKISELGYLQSGVKQRIAEIDALYHAIETSTENEKRELIICCEAKGSSDDILEDQLMAQVRTVFNRGEPDAVIPVAVKVIGTSKVLLIEFEPIRRGSELDEDLLVAKTMVIYELIPSVKGIS